MKSNVLVWSLFLGILISKIDINECTNFPAPSQDWTQIAKDDLKVALNIKQINTPAKNVILFLGDGMGIATVTGSRIYKGQLKGHSGEEEKLSFEKFPHVGLSKTYSVDAQIPDSASTGTAYLCGAKSKFYTVGCTEKVVHGDCSSVKGNEQVSILMKSKKEGKSTGIVTTTRITHATPANTYASTCDRAWEAVSSCPDVVPDIAAQFLAKSEHIDVALAGGRQYLMPNTQKDPEYPDKSGLREDNRNLISEWMEKKGSNAQYVWNQTSFDAIDTDKVESLLGLFEPGHMKYNHQRGDDPGGEPSLAEMVEKALKILSKNKNGYFLLVEAGRIDHAHHDQQAKRAFDEAVQLSKAVEKALELTDQENTLIIATADHSHTMTLGGEPDRGNPILGIISNGRLDAQDSLPYTSVGYINGVKSGRSDISGDNLDDFEYKVAGLIPTRWESHGGEDVPIYAIGPFAHLIHSTHEQHYISHVMQFASCVGLYTKEDHCSLEPSSSIKIYGNNLFITILIFFLMMMR